MNAGSKSSYDGMFIRNWIFTNVVHDTCKKATIHPSVQETGLGLQYLHTHIVASLSLLLWSYRVSYTDVGGNLGC